MNPPPRSDYHSRPLPTTPDRSYAAGSTRTPSRRDPPPIPPYPQGSATGGADWHPPRGVVDDPIRRELDEARARTAQMEKTMRWWSDCTANWREKWSKARDERNRARDECRRLRAELDSSTLERATLARQRDELSSRTVELENKLKTVSSSSLTPVDSSIKASSNPMLAAEPVALEHSNHFDSRDVKSASLGSGLNSSDAGDNSSHDQFNLKQNESGSKQSEDLESNASLSADLLHQLDEARETISQQKNEKESLSRTLDELKAELSVVSSQRDEAEKNEKEAQFQVEKLKQWKQDRMEQMASDLEDDAGPGNGIDQRLVDLRKELEKMQAENAQEWTLREKLSSEKLALERENKKMKGEITRLEEELKERARQASTVRESDLKSLQDDVALKTKELSELRHSHSRLKKTLTERTAELEHARSRLEQYELEVKKLRGRVEELKRELATAEDECDQQTNKVRRVQRSNEELQQQVDGLTIQIQHLQSRLSQTKPLSDASAGNSSEDLVANDLSENDGEMDDDYESTPEDNVNDTNSKVTGDAKDSAAENKKEKDSTDENIDG